jgi:PAS domain S-box-containing protein
MEVPARFVRDYLQAARECGLAPADLLQGLPFTRERLDEPGARVRWNDFAELTDRIGAALGTNDRIEEFGRLTGLRISPWAFVRLVPHVVSPAHLLRVALQFVGPVLFPHLGHEFVVRAGGTMRLTLSVPPSYRGSETFFRVCMGGIRASTTVFGYEAALIAVASIGPRGCVLDITPPPNRTVFGRVRSALRALRGESALFDEIARQHEAMQDVFGVLLRTQSELHQLMERVPDPLVVYRDGVILWTNAALVAALRYASQDDLRGKHLVDLVHPADKDAAAAALALPPGEARAQSFRVRATDGSFRTLELSESQRVSFEEVPARMVVARDVTERNALREQLVLTDRMSQLGFLAAGVAHEINNPLAYALAALDRATRDLDAGRLDTARDCLVIAREGAERVGGIASDLRMFTRGAEQRAEVVDLSRVLEATTDLAAVNIRTRGSLLVDLRPVPAVFGDPGRLGQVFMNLLVNAIDAIEAGDRATKRIEVRAFTDAEGRAVVEVEDNGRGIPQEIHSRLFEPFFTTKGPRSGSGLGLAICHRIVSDLGGRIEVASSPGGGALFRVLLPPHTGPLPVPAQAPRSTRRLRVLVIDDEAQLARAVGQMIEDEHDVDVATSGEEALGRLEAGADYDAVLCDMMMAGMSGMDVHARLAARRPALARRVVFMTGGAFSASAQRFLDEVKNPRLDKPFSRADVLGAVDRVQA